jgi:hypothetical protein
LAADFGIGKFSTLPRSISGIRLFTSGIVALYPKGQALSRIKQANRSHKEAEKWSEARITPTIGMRTAKRQASTPGLSYSRAKVWLSARIRMRAFPSFLFGAEFVVG